MAFVRIGDMNYDLQEADVLELAGNIRKAARTGAIVAWSGVDSTGRGEGFVWTPGVPFHYYLDTARNVFTPDADMSTTSDA